MYERKSFHSWLRTARLVHHGASRGIGIDIARAAHAAGHQVVATGRNAPKVTEAVGEHESLLAVELDVTKADTAESAVLAAVEGFGRIDVLVNNAGNFYAGYFENISAAQLRAQMGTNFIGPLNVTRAVLPMKPIRYRRATPAVESSVDSVDPCSGST